MSLRRGRAEMASNTMRAKVADGRNPAVNQMAGVGRKAGDGAMKRFQVVVELKFCSIVCAGERILQRFELVHARARLNG
jgi:hypothetical protein